MDPLGRKSAHISGELLGGWVAAYIAIHHPERIERMALNTSAAGRRIPR